MAVWYTARSMRWSTRAVIAAALLAVLLVLAVPVALFVGVIMMLLGHVVGGLALFGASILAAVAAVVIASMSGVRHVRKLVMQRIDLVSQRGDRGTQQDDQVTAHDDRVVRLNQGEYYYE
jgi:uncharacterized membrane protein YdjX (TVP38/TMEM64 family)